MTQNKLIVGEHGKANTLQEFIENHERNSTLSHPDVAGWMPIETAPEGKNVLVWYKGGVDVAWRYGEVWQIDTKRIEAPTHWMPLPDAPLKQSTAKDTPHDTK